MVLVLGPPNPVALRVVEHLSAKGDAVVVVGSPELRSSLPESVELCVGDAASIDFGLSGRRYLELLASVDEIVLADTTYVSSGEVERNRFVRQAAEVAEFVKAGGGQKGVRFLSSLLVFGSAKGEVSEDEFEVGQRFRDEFEESLAVAEKIIRDLGHRCPISILRCAPVAGDDRTGELFPSAPLSHLARQVISAPSDIGHTFTDLPVHFETVERVAKSLFRLQPKEHTRVAHLVDKNPLTDRALIHWLAKAANKRVHERAPGPRPWSSWGRASYPGGRTLAGWGLRFRRDFAEEQLTDLLDPDREALLEGLFSRESRIA